MTERIMTDANGCKHITTERLLHPPKREWVGLTNEEIYTIVAYPWGETKEWVRAIEKALKEKNT